MTFKAAWTGRSYPPSPSEKLGNTAGPVWTNQSAAQGLGTNHSQAAGRNQKVARELVPAVSLFSATIPTRLRTQGTMSIISSLAHDDTQCYFCGSVGLMKYESSYSKCVNIMPEEGLK